MLIGFSLRKLNSMLSVDNYIYFFWDSKKWNFPLIRRFLRSNCGTCDWAAAWMWIAFIKICKIIIIYDREQSAQGTRKKNIVYATGEIQAKGKTCCCLLSSSRISSVWSCSSRDAIAQESERVKEFIYFWAMYMSIKEVNAEHCRCSMLFVVFCRPCEG